MATKESGEFEQSLERLEEIVAKLDGDDVGLDESVELFKEGKALARKCETLLKSAQAAVDRAAAGEIPNAVAAAPTPIAPQAPRTRPAPSSPLFDDPIDEDEVPF